ncbi:MAG: hypothetical protein AABY16_00425 [Nanoarchaeota archaeon]
MRKEWWYVIALVAIVLVVMIVFKEDIVLSPEKNNENYLMSDSLESIARDDINNDGAESFLEYISGGTG